MKLEIVDNNYPLIKLYTFKVWTRTINEVHVLHKYCALAHFWAVKI